MLIRSILLTIEVRMGLKAGRSHRNQGCAVSEIWSWGGFRLWLDRIHDGAVAHQGRKGRLDGLDPGFGAGRTRMQCWFLNLAPQPGAFGELGRLRDFPSNDSDLLTSRVAVQAPVA